MNAMTRSRYDGVAMTLHWLIAALILWDFVLAISFSRFDPGDALYFSFAYDQHMSIGMWVLLFSLLRLAWRLAHRFPPPPTEMRGSMRAMARASHALLYVFMLGAPLSGWVVLSVRKKPPPFLGELHWPAIGPLVDMAHPQRTVIHDAFLPGHIWFSYMGMALLGVHVLAALYHHYFKRDDVMRRMLPWTKVTEMLR